MYMYVYIYIYMYIYIHIHVYIYIYIHTPVMLRHGAWMKLPTPEADTDTEAADTCTTRYRELFHGSDAANSATCARGHLHLFGHAIVIQNLEDLSCIRARAKMRLFTFWQSLSQILDLIGIIGIFAYYFLENKGKPKKFKIKKKK